MARILGDGEGSLNVREISEVGASNREDETSGPVLRVQQTGRVAVNAFGVPNDLVTPD